MSKMVWTTSQKEQHTIDICITYTHRKKEKRKTELQHVWQLEQRRNAVMRECESRVRARTLWGIRSDAKLIYTHKHHYQSDQKKNEKKIEQQAILARITNWEQKPMHN